MSQAGFGSNVICQVALVVRDIQKTAGAWADALGVPTPNIVVTDVQDKTHANYRGSPTQARAKLAFFNVGPQLSLEIIEPVGAPSVWRDFLDAKGDGVHHVAFHVEGMAQAVAYLDGKGMGLVQRGDFVGGQYAYMDSAGKLGVMLELLAK